MMTRRDALRSLLWAGAGIVGVQTLTSCGGAGGPGGGGPAFAVSSVARAPGDLGALPGVARTVRDFTAELYRVAAATTTGNLVMSPYSVVVALAMTRNGARGTTSDEIDAVLNAPSLDELNAGMNALTRGIESRAGERERRDGTEVELVLATASSLWGQSDLTWEQDFLDTLAREYGAGMHLVDYAEDLERARTRINGWTAGRTAGKIPELVADGVLDHLTRLVLVNAIHFRSPWEEPFEETQAGVPFTLADGDTAELEMVAQTSQQAYHARGEGWVAARLPYPGGQLAMALVVPDDLEAFELRLDGAAMAGLLDGFSRPPGGVRVTMPRWDFRSQLQLKDLLVELGMPTAFDPAAADLSGITSDARLYLTHVVHEATITVDEEGTEAAAATAAVAGVTSAPTDEPEPVVADRPFLFVIHDIASGTPLFVGRVTDPR